MCVFLIQIAQFYVMENNDDEIVIKVGLRIKELRTAKGLSQFKLSILIGISENQLSRIERGESNPTIKTLNKIAKALEIDIKDFF